ncbi:MAG: hypothetical protein ACTHLD_15480, partial [Chitinophaga sp.]
EQLEHDERLTLRHVGLYLALFRCWNNSFFNNPFYISRAKLMKIGHIGSCNTFARVIRELENFGYINYFPPGRKGSASQVSVIPMMPAPKQKKVIPAGIRSDTREGVPEIPQTEENIQQPDNFDTAPVSAMIHTNKPFKNSNKKTGSQMHSTVKKFEPPSKDEVVAAFRSWGVPEVDAKLFYLHYQANGWYQSGKVAIQDWKAAAEKWILNSKKFKPKNNASKPGNLNAGAGSNYAEPI